MDPTGDTVLILTHSADQFVVERVGDAVRAAGARVVRFDTDLFPSEARLSARMEAREHVHILRIGEQQLEAGQVRAVWARRIWTPRVPEDLAPAIAEGCRRESTATLHGWLSALEDRRWVNPLHASERAEDKLRQLRVAVQHGLRIPRTLVSNDPDEVRAFRESVGPLVAKMLRPLSVSMGRAELFVHTNLVRDEDLAHLDGLSSSPMVFQELVQKQIELRVACVGRRAFAGAIDASRSDEGRVDWRRARPDEVSWQPWDLPADIARRLFDVLAALGLTYGAVDLIVTPEDEYVFLEVNPSGEWGMLERDLDLPIGAALADELLEETPCER